MQRKAVLIGNTSGLEGVKVDLERFRLFLKSDIGGGWLDHEIENLVNRSKNDVTTRIRLLKAQHADYVIVLFSGHGGQIRETVLELNGDGERIEESVLYSIAPRQLTIYDCCRCYPEPILESYLVEKREATFAKAVSYVRERYDRRIMEAIPQQARLYSCSKGESSYDSKDGGIYLQNLLKSAKTMNGEFKLVGIAHQEAQEPTRVHSVGKAHGPQNPESELPKCLSERQLIISIKP